MFEGFKSRYIKVKKGKVFCKIKGEMDHLYYYSMVTPKHI